MPRVGNWDAVPKEPRLLHHEAGSCRVDEGLAPVEVVALGEPRADAGLLERQHDLRGCSGLVEGLEDGDDEVGELLPRLRRRLATFVPRRVLVRNSPVDVVEVRHVARVRPDDGLDLPKNPEVEGLGQMGRVGHEEHHLDPVRLQEPEDPCAEMRRAPVQDEDGTVVEVPDQTSQLGPLCLDRLQKTSRSQILKMAVVTKLFPVERILTVLGE